MACETHTWLQLAVIIALSWQSSAWLNGEDFSRSFEECFTIREKAMKNVPFNKGVYEQYCTDLLIPLDKFNQRIGNFSAGEMGYIQGLFRKVYQLACNTAAHRTKRSTDVMDSHIGQVATRTEIRSFNGANFQRYANAIQRLKETGEYDIIADIHTTVVYTAHFGVNLLPWHRLYLMVLEAACGVPIPYWDSSVDAYMKDPTQSIVWTEKFFGNGIGKVVTGPFAHFSTPAGPLFRKIGATGALLERRIVYNIWTKGYLSEISTPTASHESNAEGQHNNVHAWVNGVMGNIAISSYDPVFFCFHAHLDYVWEIFRVKQAARGVNSEFDLVKTKAKGQRPDDPSGFKGLSNIDGYTQQTSKVDVYRMWPQCTFCDGNRYVYCDPVRKACVSTGCDNPIRIEQLKDADRLARDSGLCCGKFGQPFRPFTIDPRTRNDPVQLTVPVM